MAEHLSAQAPGSAPLVSRRHVLIGGTLAAASILAIERQPKPSSPVISPERFEKWVPKKAGIWSVSGTSGLVLPPPDALRDRLYDNLVTTVYQAADAPAIMLLMAYNNVQDGVLQVHRPEICYSVGGFTLTEMKEVSLSALGKPLPAKIFTAKGPGRTEQVAYFTRLGNDYPRSWAEQRLSVVRANLAGNIPDGMMMRVSLVAQEQAEAFGVLERFVTDFVAASAPDLQKLLVVL